jgi:hypothetical protein
VCGKCYVGSNNAPGPLREQIGLNGGAGSPGEDDRKWNLQGK